jgi:hypothetical protein
MPNKLHPRTKRFLSIGFIVVVILSNAGLLFATDPFLDEPEEALPEPHWQFSGEVMLAWRFVLQDFLARPELTNEEKDLARYRAAFHVESKIITIQLQRMAPTLNASPGRNEPLVWVVNRAGLEIMRRPPAPTRSTPPAS